LEKVFNLKEIEKKHPYLLSYGQKGRLNIAAILSYRPKLLLLDEIFIGQDLENIQILMDFIYQYIQSESAGAIIVNHHPEIMKQYTTSGYKLKDGMMHGINLGAAEKEKSEYWPRAADE